MDRFQMNRSGCRPYQYTCGTNTAPFSRRDCSSSDMSNRGSQNCNSMKQNMQKENCRDQEMYSHLKHLVPAMAYVPCQEFTPTFELCKALNAGTIFPQLCKPFCGRRGGCR